MRFIFSVIVALGNLLGNAAQEPVRVRVPAESLLALKIRPAKLKFKVGDIIYVTAILRGGKQGVYLSNLAGEAGLRGLFLGLSDLDKKSVLTCGFGSSGPDRIEGADPEQILDREFMFLKPKEVQKFRHSLPCVPKVPGRYLVTGEYSPMDPITQRVAALAKSKGRVLLDTVTAKPVEITIE
jgi:hypothetical protein